MIPHRKLKLINDEVNVNDLLFIVKSNYHHLIFFIALGLIVAVLLIFATKPQFETRSNIKFVINPTSLDDNIKKEYGNKAIKLALLAMSNRSFYGSSFQICHKYTNKYLSDNLKAFPSVDRSGVVLRLRSPTIYDNHECLKSVADFLLYDPSLSNLQTELLNETIVKKSMHTSSNSSSEIVILNQITVSQKLILRNNTALLIGGAVLGIILFFIICFVKHFYFRVSARENLPQDKGS